MLPILHFHSFLQCFLTTLHLNPLPRFSTWPVHLHLPYSEHLHGFCLSQNGMIPVGLCMRLAAWCAHVTVEIETLDQITFLFFSIVQFLAHVVG